MKYNFNETIDRKNNKYSFSIKWQNNDNLFTYDKEFDDQICFQLADMDFKTAPEIIEDLKNCASYGVFGYSSPNKLYYDTVVKWHNDEYHINCTNDDCYVCGTGTHQVIKEIFTRCTKVGDGIIVLTPSYNYHWDIDPLKRHFVGVEMINNNGYYSIDFDKFEEACKDKNNTLFILCNPHNPTGRIFNKEELLKISKICLDNNVLVVSDEVHSDLIRFNNEFYSAGSIMDKSNLILCTAVNKTFNLAGLAMTNFFIFNDKLKELFKDYRCLPTPFGLTAVISAYTKGKPWLNELNLYLDDLVKTSVDFINNNFKNVHCFLPEASYILWVDFSKTGKTKEELQDIIYNKCHILDQAGDNFDSNAMFRRFCLTSPKNVVMDGLKRLEKYFK